MTAQPARRIVRLTVDGSPQLALPGRTVAAVLLAMGRVSWRTTRTATRPRGLFCGIGVCHDCLVVVNGLPDVRACRREVADGDRIETQRGAELPGGGRLPAEAPGAAGAGALSMEPTAPERTGAESAASGGARPDALSGLSPAGARAGAQAGGGEHRPAEAPGAAGLDVRAGRSGPPGVDARSRSARPPSAAASGAVGPEVEASGATRSKAVGGLPRPGAQARCGGSSRADARDGSMGPPSAAASGAAGPGDAASGAARLKAVGGPSRVDARSGSAGPPSAEVPGAAGLEASGGPARPVGSAGHFPSGPLVVVVGAGPAGMAAALAAAEGGVRVVLVDGGGRVGGQFHRRAPVGFASGARDHPLERAIAAHARIECLARADVWAVEPGPGRRHHLVHVQQGPADGTGRRARTLAADALILCTGAYDRALPFPGWELPGVVTAGAAQALAKGQRAAIGRRVVVAGTGPFLLPVATSLLTVGARVLGVYEAGSPARWLRHPVAAARAGGRAKAAELSAYAAELARHRVPYRPRAAVVAAHGHGRVEAVTVARLDAGWRIRPGSERRLEGVDAVCVGYGFTPQLELALSAGCALRDGHVAVDAHQATSVPGVYAAGELTGIGGAEAAAAEGELAGAAAALTLTVGGPATAAPAPAAAAGPEPPALGATPAAAGPGLRPEAASPPAVRSAVPGRADATAVAPAVPGRTVSQQPDGAVDTSYPAGSAVPERSDPAAVTPPVTPERPGVAGMPLSATGPVVPGWREGAAATGPATPERPDAAAVPRRATGPTPPERSDPAAAAPTATAWRAGAPHVTTEDGASSAAGAATAKPPHDGSLTSASPTGTPASITASAALAALVARVRATRRFAALLADAHPVRDGWRSWLAEDTVVCRCEEVTYGQVREAVVGRGAEGMRALKLTCRVGLGACQGRVCGRNVAELAGALLGGPGAPPGLADPHAADRRPIAQPVRLGDLAAFHEETDPTAPPRRRKGSVMPRSTAPSAPTAPPTNLTGLIVATALPYADDPTAPAGLRPDLDRYAEHCRWLVANGVHGVGPNGSLGEYSSLTDAERRAVARTAVEAVGGDALVVVGVHGPGAHQARAWAEAAAEDGADGVLCLPPTLYRANTAEIVHHFTEVARAGLPVMVYNNPLDTKVDLTPEILRELAAIDGVVAVKEFSGDVRRILHIKEQAPGLAPVAGADDLVLEALLMGATGWFAGFPNVFPAASVRLYELALAGRLAEARALYEPLVAAFRWDSRTEFVQAIKHGMDLVGRPGGPCRPPRGPLPPDRLAQLDADMKRALQAIEALQVGEAAPAGEAVQATVAVQAVQTIEGVQAAQATEAAEGRPGSRGGR